MITKVRVSDQVIEALQQIIKEEGFVPGDKFYSENQLKDRLQVSRSSIREAIKLLEVSGFVRVHHGKGIFITDPQEGAHQAFSQWLKNNESSVFEHFEVRLIVDPKAASYAAKNAKAQDISNMEGICQKFEEALPKGSTSDLIRLDEQFHLAIAKATKNRTLYMIMKTMTQTLHEGWISSLNIPGRSEKTILEHRAVLEAIRRGEQKSAESLMEGHLLRAIEDIRKSLRKQ